MRNRIGIMALGLLLIAAPAKGIIDSSLQMQLGNPSNATADTNNHDHYLISRAVEAIDYNDTHGEPNWASWDLTANDLGSVNRSPNFFVDTNLPGNFYRVGTGEYSGSGYDRGHLCPSADRTDTTNDNEAVFYMSNIMPQASDNNSGVWANFESYCRSLVQSTNDYELLITCGPSGFDGSYINTNGYVWIPQYTWKIVVVVPPGGGTAASRITATNRVITIKVPNTNGVSTIWQDFVTSVNQIQVDTGYTFFTALPSDVAAALRAKVDGQTNPPPSIYSFSPTNGSANTSVIIIGTNFTSASVVAFNGAAASFALNSDTQITALVPTNAGSGFISITTPSGTAISTNTFTVLNNGGSVYTGILAGWDMSGLLGGVNNYGPSPMTPTTNAPNISVVGLTRGAGVKTGGTAAAGGWGGNGFTNTTAATAIASNQFATFSLTASNGYKMSFSSISRYDYRCSGTGPTNGLVQFQVGIGLFVDITNLTYSFASGGATNIPIDLSGISALQNIGANTNVTFRIVNYNANGSAGNWYVYDYTGNSALDLAVRGTVTQIVTNPPAGAPSLSAPVFANNQFQFTVTGTTGSNYVVQVSTNLAATNWTPVVTNTAPFLFIESNVNVSAQRFYRGLIGP